MGLNHLEYLKEIQEFEYHDTTKYIKKGTTLSYVEVFFNFLDASNWVQHHLEEYNKDEWHLEQCSINYINGAYRSGLVFSKRQKTLFDMTEIDPLGR